jgi:hypothetical protein
MMVEVDDVDLDRGQNLKSSFSRIFYGTLPSMEQNTLTLFFISRL